MLLFAALQICYKKSLVAGLGPTVDFLGASDACDDAAVYYWNAKTNNNLIYEILAQSGMAGTASDNEDVSLVFVQSLVITQSFRDGQVVAQVPGHATFTRKAALATNLVAYLQAHPRFRYVHPLTFVLPTQQRQFEEHHARSPRDVFLFKPSGSGRGAGIRFLRADERPPGAGVAQLYLPPILHEGFKFDLRVYIMLTGVDPLTVYLHDEGLARFASERYREPVEGDRGSAQMHLTNTAVNTHPYE